jgi:thymidylate synthase
MKQVIDLYKMILKTFKDGHRENRTAVPTIDIFGHQMRFDLSEGFPLMTTKFVSFENVKAELLWFISGSTNINDLKALYPKCNIWDAWATESGDLGPVYGYEWNRNDQLNKVVEEIKSNPNSRRLVVNAWNTDNLPDPKLPPNVNAANGKAALMPCHCLFQSDVSRDNKLSLQLYQRSCDTVLGLPYNIPSYALLQHMMAKVANLEVGEFIWTGGNIHIYTNQIDTLVREQLDNEPLPLPTLRFNEDKVYTKLSDFTMDDIWVENYQHHGVVRYPPAAV